jgi:hypothetical protein
VSDAQAFELWNASAYFSSASSEVKVLGAFFCNFLAARQPESPMVSRATGYQMLWVRGFRDHTISRCGAISRRLVVRPSRAAIPAQRAHVIASKAKRPRLKVSNRGVVWIAVRHLPSCDRLSPPERIGPARPWMHKGESAWGSRTRGFLLGF